MTTWVTDVRELAPAPEMTAEATRRADVTRALVEAATSRHVAAPWCCAVCCLARVGRKTCRTRLHVGQPEAGRVAWSCSTCGDRGEITGFEGTALDLSPYVPRKKKVRVWGFDDESREVLLAGTTEIPSLRDRVARGASPGPLARLAVPVPAVTPRAQVEHPLARLRALDLANGDHAAPCRKLAEPAGPVRHHRASNRAYPRATEGSERLSPGPHPLQRARSCALSASGAKPAGEAKPAPQRPANPGPAGADLPLLSLPRYATTMPETTSVAGRDGGSPSARAVRNSAL